MAQAVHAAFEHSHQHRESTSCWLAESNYLVIVAADNETHLEHFALQAVRRGISFTAVREPDLDDQLTAVAFSPGDLTRRLLSSLPLALREAVPL